MSLQTMVDLETFSSDHDAVITSIGAYCFDTLYPRVGERFYCVVDAQSCVDVGLKMSVSTVLWWLQQEQAARDALTKPVNPARPLSAALLAFSEWYTCHGKGTKVWGNGATFDNVVLDSAYKATGLQRPWSYRDDACYRTLKNMFPEVPLPPSEGTKHNALDDAIWQAQHLAMIYRHLKLA